jgi:hypothetical protein
VVVLGLLPMKERMLTLFELMPVTVPFFHPSAV